MQQVSSLHAYVLEQHLLFHIREKITTNINEKQKKIIKRIEVTPSF
jgi:hypothetical protein